MGITKHQLSNILSPNFDPLKSNVRLLCDTLNVSFTDIIEDNQPQTNVAEQLSIYKLLGENPQDVEEYKLTDQYVDIRQIKPLTTYNVVELFAGTGGLALGLEQAGFNTVGLVEIDKHCCQTLRTNRPDWNVIEEDIVKVAEQGIHQYIPDIEIDLLSGGYPCQAFSYAGKKLGLEDVRGTMFYYFASILNQLKPKMFLAENVRGLISHDHGNTLRSMIEVFQEIGYRVNYALLNAWHYGVAQKRERVIIVGIREDVETTYVLPKPFDYLPTLKDALKDVPPSIGATYPEHKKRVLDLVPPGGYWRDLPDDIAREYMGKSYFSGGGRTGMARRISWDEPCLTLTTSPAQKQTERCHPDETRPFTVREYARIQSFPDDWIFTGPLHAQYRQIGNAVPVNFAKAIGLSIVHSLNQISKQKQVKESINLVS